MTTQNGARQGVAPRPARGAAPATADACPSEAEADRILLVARRTTERTHSILDLAAEGFDEQPTAACVLAASRRLCANIAALADGIAKRRAA